jgi:predicted permease
MPRLPGVRRLLRLPRVERDLTAAVDEELSFHIDMLIEQSIAAGSSPDAARREAMIRFGDLERVRQRCYDISNTHEAAVRRTELWTTLWQDVKYAVRSLTRAPGFSLVILLTLALGIGATTAMFSVVRGVLLRPLPFPEPERVIRVWPANPTANVDRGQVSGLEIDDWARELQGFAAVGGFRLDDVGAVYGDGPEPIYVPTTHVTSGFFPALGTRAELGRTMTASEHVPGANHVAVVSHGFWARQLGGDPQAIGRSIRLDGEPFAVIGVMPPDFSFPTPDAAVWIPASLLTEPDMICCGRDARWLDVVARLRPGVTSSQGQSQLQAVLRRLAATYPKSNGGWISASIESVRDSIVGPVRRGLLVLLGAVGLVLLVVCVNVANLMLVRGTARERELALRAAIGASRGRIVRLLLTESVLLAVIGGALGVLAAWWGVRTLVELSGRFLPRAADVRVDAGVLAFAIVVSLVTGALFGLWPALRASAGTGTASTLREDARGSVGSGVAHRARAMLVTAEVALAMVLVVGAGLMLRSFQRLTAADPGFRPDQVLLVRFSLPYDAAAAPGAIGMQRQRVVERVRAVPGVASAGATKNAPLTQRNGELRSFTVPGRPVPPAGEEPRVMVHPATPGYLRTMGIPLLAGEDINVTAGDTTAGAVAVISRRMAEQVWPGRSPIGESFTFGGVTIRVIGVAGDVRYARLDSVAGFTAYVPDRNMPRLAMSLVVRTTGDPARLAGGVRAAVREVFPGVAFQEVVPLGTKVSEAASTPRFFTVLVAIFGALALALAAVGLYGVVSYAVRQREREMAVRLALGAPPARVLGLMLRQGMTPVVVGLAIGVAAALAVTRILHSLLFEVSATDPVTFVGVAVLLGVVALVASYLPSRRAAAVQPSVMLRGE